jgi:hypothetical protein
MGQSYVKVDVQKNRLYVTIPKKFSQRDLDDIYTDIRFGVADLSPGFTVISDYSNCSLVAVSALGAFKRILQFLIESRVNIVVRIINSNSLVFRQFMNYITRSQGYKAINVASLEEAELELQKVAERSELRFYLYEQVAHISHDQGSFEGDIIDISLNGCAVRCDASFLEPGAQVEILVQFSNQPKLPDSLKAQATVVKVEENFLAVHYEPLGASEKDELWKRLVFESKCDIR